METINETSDETYKKFIPYVTATCCLVSLILFFGFNLEEGIPTWETYKKWGAPNTNYIFEGDYWGLITSNFLHVEIWHIAFNIYWVWLFGKKIEFESSRIFYILLILSGALVSSLAQLAFSDSTGIGLSGIGYAFFGYLYLKNSTEGGFHNFLQMKTIKLFIFWLGLCLFLTRIKAWNVGNAAHIGGLLWGVLLAYISRYNKIIQWTLSLIYLTCLTGLIFFSPLSTSYLSFQAFELHKSQKVEEAIIAYKKILSVDSENTFAIENLKQLEIHQLEVKASECQMGGKYSEARILYNQILLIDKNNEWAKECLRGLPAE